MNQPDTHIRIPLCNVMSQMLGTVDRTVLSSRASETHHKARKAASGICLYMRIDDCIYMVEISQDFPILFKKTDDRFISSRQLPVCFISAGVMYGTAVKYLASSVA